MPISQSECKCLSAIKNRQEVSLIYCTNQTKRLMEKLKRKPLSSPVSVKAVQWKGWGLWREGFKEKVSFEFRVEKSRSDGQWQW